MLFIADLRANGLREKVMNDMLHYYVILLKIDWMYNLLIKSSWKWVLVNR